MGLCIGEFVYYSEGWPTWKTGLCKCGIISNPHMQRLWALPSSEQVGLSSVFYCSVVDPVVGLQTTKTSHTLLWLTHLVAKIQQRGTCLFLTSYDEAVTLFLSVPTNWLCILSLNLSPISLVITSLHPHSVDISLQLLCYLLFLRSILLASPLVTRCQILQSYCIRFFFFLTLSRHVSVCE